MRARTCCATAATAPPPAARSRATRSTRSARRSRRTPRASLAPEDLVPRERVDAVVAGDELGLALAEELARLAPFGMGNPAVTLLVPAARARPTRGRWGRASTSRFTVESGGGARARASRSARTRLPDGRDEPRSTPPFAPRAATRWNGAVEPRLVLRARRSRRARRRSCCSGEPRPDDWLGVPRGELARGARARHASRRRPGRRGRIARARARPPRRRHRRRSLGALVAAGEPRARRRADAPRRARRRSQARVGGFALVLVGRARSATPALAAGSTTSSRSTRPPTGRRRAAARAGRRRCDPSGLGGRLSYALRCGSIDVGLRACALRSCALYRALRDGGGAAGDALERAAPRRTAARPRRRRTPARLRARPRRSSGSSSRRRERRGRSRSRDADAHASSSARAAFRGRYAATRGWPAILDGTTPTRPPSGMTAPDGDGRGRAARRAARRSSTRLPVDGARAPATAHAGRARRTSRRPSARCSATCSRSSRSTPTRRRSQIDRDARRATRSSSPASTTPTSGASRARTSSSTRSASRRSARACGSTPRRSCAALLHDTVEDTVRLARRGRASVRRGGRRARRRRHEARPGITFQSRDEAQAENYRKMMVAMATDIRVILIKLADRLHNMRTIGAMPQAEADREGQGDARDLRADRAPARHPRDQVGARGPRVRDAAPAQVPGDQGPGQPAARRARALRHRGRRLPRAASSRRSASTREISGRAKHFYSIYSKMTKKGREFNEIYDLTAMRVIVDSVKDCYGAVGVIHSLWKPLPGRFKDFVAMPKFNMYQSLHTTVIGPEGRPLEIQIRTREMHDMAEFGVAAHWLYKDDRGSAARSTRGRRQAASGCARCSTGSRSCRTRKEFMDTSKVDLFEEEVFVFTPKGEVKSLAAGRDAARLRLRGPHRGRPPLRRREGQRQDRPAALRAEVRRHRRGAHVQARARPVARLARASSRRRARATRSSSGSRRSRARTPSTPAASCCRST